MSGIRPRLDTCKQGKHPSAILSVPAASCVFLGFVRCHSSIIHEWIDPPSLSQSCFLPQEELSSQERQSQTCEHHCGGSLAPGSILFLPSCFLILSEAQRTAISNFLNDECYTRWNPLEYECVCDHFQRTTYSYQQCTGEQLNSSFTFAHPNFKTSVS